MPKKVGVNTKSVEAKARKETAKRIKEEAIQKQKEDEYWRDDDKLINRKMERHSEREKKKVEQAQRKALNKAAYEQEINELEAKKVIPTKNKVTRSQIQDTIVKQAEKDTPKKDLTHLQVELEENVNRMTIEGDQARNIDEAISILSTNEVELDRHPERRVKAAYAAFEEKRLTELKNENPNLRLSQLKQILKKEWMKSEENPLNQRTLSFNTKE